MELFHNKYLKYKQKYNSLKNNIQRGGDAIQENDSKLEFYLFKAEWCGHCINFKPYWEEMQNNNNLTDKIKFITYDSNEHKTEMKEWNITGFPTLILKKNNIAIEYEGPRKINNIINFINIHLNN